MTQGCRIWHTTTARNLLPYFHHSIQIGICLRRFLAFHYLRVIAPYCSRCWLMSSTPPIGNATAVQMTSVAHCLIAQLNFTCNKTEHQESASCHPSLTKRPPASTSLSESHKDCEMGSATPHPGILLDGGAQRLNSATRSRQKPRRSATSMYTNASSARSCGGKRLPSRQWLSCISPLALLLPPL